MKTALVSMLSLAAFALSGQAQANGTEKAEPNPHTLKWTVQKGTEVKGEFQPASTDVKPKALPLGVAEVHAHPVVR